jgi:hypothetical protein
MRQVAALVLAVCFLTLGSGAAEYLHNAQHEREDAASAAGDRAGAPAGHPDDHPAGPLHNDTNCRTHAILHSPLLTGGWVPLLVFLGLFVAFLTLLPRSLTSLRLPLRIDCRGPPVSRSPSPHRS